MDRRRFVETVLFGAATVAAMSPAFLADPAALARDAARRRRPVRVRGVVRCEGRGVAGVAVSDGISIVPTGADGTFELLTTGARRFVQIGVPAGFRIPVNPTGTARFYTPLEADERGEATAIFELERLRRSDERHVLLLLGDVQTEDRGEMRAFHEQTVPDILATRRALGEVETFAIACGDIMFDNLELYPDYERAVVKTGIPFFQVVGNHDLDQKAPSDEGSTFTFESHFGPRWYSFDRGEVHYIALDDVFWHGSGYIGHLDADQLAWLAADLSRVERGRTVVVSMHIPPQGSYRLRGKDGSLELGVQLTNRDALFRLLEPFRAHILAGHLHESAHRFDGGRHEHVTGAVCGAWWSGPICGDGTPCGYAIYDVRGSEVTWRAKATGAAGDATRMRAYAHGADPEAPDEIVVNAWDWDPAWTLVWYEDGEGRGALAPREGARDPLSVSLHLGPDKPARRTWVEPYPNVHMFYAKASRTARKITIEATDRFGRVETIDVPAR